LRPTCALPGLAKRVLLPLAREGAILLLRQLLQALSVHSDVHLMQATVALAEPIARVVEDLQRQRPVVLGEPPGPYAS